MFTNGRLDAGNLSVFAEISTFIPAFSAGFVNHFLTQDVTASTSLLEVSHGMSFERISVLDLMSCKARLQSPCCTPVLASTDT